MVYDKFCSQYSEKILVCHLFQSSGCMMLRMMQILVLLLSLVCVINRHFGPCRAAFSLAVWHVKTRMIQLREEESGALTCVFSR